MKLANGLLLVLLVVAAGLCGIIYLERRATWEARQPAVLAAERERLARELASEQAHDAAAAPWRARQAAAWGFVGAALPIVLFVGVILASGALGVAAALAFFRRYLPYHRPDERGLLPVPTMDLHRGAAAQALGAYHHTAAQAAARTLPPHVYSPHLSVGRDTGASLPRRDTDEQPALAVSADVRAPTFAQLLADGQIGPSRPLYLGLDVATNAPITGSWRDVYSGGIGGLQGAGKTWAAAVLAAQCALNGAGLIVCDPNAGDVESLANRLAPLRDSFLADVAQEPAEIVAALRYADDEIQRRKAGDAARWAFIVVVDEWTELMRKYADQVTPIIEEITTQGRKYNVHVLLLGHRWSTDDAGGGIIRNNLASALVLRMRRAEAAMLTGLGRNTPHDTLQLAPGEGYLMTTRGQLARVRLPIATDADLVAVGDILRTTPRPFGFRTPANTAPLDAEPTHERRASDAAADVAPTAAASAKPLAAAEARMLELFVSGMSVPEITREVFGLKTSGGQVFRDRRAEVEAVLRARLKGDV